MPKRPIVVMVEDTEYAKIERYAKAKGHGGKLPAATFAHYAVFGMMKKNPLSEAEAKEYGE